jgi:hypothetical protein
MIPGNIPSFVIDAAAAVAAAYLRPDADIGTGGWKTQGSATTGLYQTIDETTASDADFVMAPPFVAGSSDIVLAIGNMVPEDDTLLWGTSSFAMLSESFIATGTSIKKVRLKLRKTGAPSDGVQVKVFTVDASHIPVTEIGAAGVIDASSITAAYAVYEAVFATPVSVTNGAEYCIVISRTGALNTSNAYNVPLNFSNTYAAGYFHYLYGSAWQATYATTFEWPMEIVQGGGTTVMSLNVRLFEGATEIAEWTHASIPDTFTTAEQTLTGPQFAAIGDFSDLFVEFDDNDGHTYLCQLSDPSGGVAEPVVVRYRYGKVVA